MYISFTEFLYKISPATTILVTTILIVGKYKKVISTLFLTPLGTEGCLESLSPAGVLIRFYKKHPVHVFLMFSFFGQLLQDNIMDLIYIWYMGVIGPGKLFILR